MATYPGRAPIHERIASVAGPCGMGKLPSLDQQRRVHASVEEAGATPGFRVDDAGREVAVARDSYSSGVAAGVTSQGNAFLCPISWLGRPCVP